MTPWLFRLPLRHLSQYPGRTFLGILGIALGTAVYLSISLAAASAIQSFQAGVTAMAGKAQWRIQSPGAPLDENLFARLRCLPEVKAAAHYICQEGGGRGAVREIVELILKGQGLWDQVTAPYFSPGFSPG